MKESINYTDLKDAVLKLNPDIRFDESTLVAYMTGNKNRTGVYYHDRYITPIDRGQIPYEQQADDMLVPVSITIAKALRMTNPIVVTDSFPENHVFCGMLNQLMGNVPEKVVQLGDGTEVLLQRDYNAAAKQNWINIMYPFAEKKMKGHIFQVGWKLVIDNLVSANIPDITRESLSTELNIDL